MSILIFKLIATLLALIALLLPFILKYKKIYKEKV